MSIVTLLLTASRQPYRRGGLAIGPKHAPTRVQQGAIDVAAILAILRDPAISLSEEYSEVGGDTYVRKVSDADRKHAIATIETALAAATAVTGDETAALVAQVLGDETTLTSESYAKAKDAMEAGLITGGGDISADRTELVTTETTNTAPEASLPAGAETAAPAAEAGAADKGPSSEPTAGKPARKAKPREATLDKA